jgi:hypothetical protein
MKKTCIFEENILCSNCGECTRCDLNENKKCNNCGKCLELEGFDARAINIEEILDEGDLTFSNEEENLEEDTIIDIEALSELNKDLDESDVKIEYIDDIDGLSEILENENSKKYISEVFPGVMIINTNIK